MFYELVDNVFNIAIHNGGDVGTRIVDAMVGDAVLREVVGADFFGAVASADEGFTGLGGVFHLFFFFALEEAGAEDIHSFDAILLLGAFVLHGHHETSG